MVEPQSIKLNLHLMFLRELSSASADYMIPNHQSVAARIAGGPQNPKECCRVNSLFVSAIVGTTVGCGIVLVVTLLYVGQL